MGASGTSTGWIRATRWFASVALWIAGAFAMTRILIALGVPAFVALAVAFLGVSLFVEPSSCGRRAFRRLRHGRTDR